jgi:hypothetical protein
LDDCLGRPCAPPLNSEASDQLIEQPNPNMVNCVVLRFNLAGKGPKKNGEYGIRNLTRDAIVFHAPAKVVAQLLVNLSYGGCAKRHAIGSIRLRD